MLSIDQTYRLVSNGSHQGFKSAYLGPPSSGIPLIGASRTVGLMVPGKPLKGIRTTGGIPKVRYVAFSLSQSAMIPKDLNSSFWAATS